MHIAHINLAKGFRGGERQTELLIRALAAHGIRQTLVCRPESPLIEHLSDLPELRLHCAARPYSSHGRFRAAPDLLHAHEAKAVYWAYLESRLRGTPYLVTRRVDNPLGRGRLTRAAYARASAAVALSGAVRATLEGYIAPARLHVIPSMCAGLGHDPAQTRALRAPLQGRFVVGHIGALVDKHKGQAVIIDAARRLARQAPALYFMLLGDGDDAAELQRRAADLSNLQFVGFRPNVGDYLALFDAFVYPSRMEGLGSALLDVMDYQVPLVASRVGGIPDVIEHEHNGLLAPPGDAQALADAVLRLYREPELRARLTANARAELGAYAPERIGARYLALYRELLGREDERARA